MNRKLTRNTFLCKVFTKGYIVLGEIYTLRLVWGKDSLAMASLYMHSILANVNKVVENNDLSGVMTPCEQKAPLLQMFIVAFTVAYLY